jgi:hypothetical protein
MICATGKSEIFQMQQFLFLRISIPIFNFAILRKIKPLQYVFSVF